MSRLHKMELIRSKMNNKGKGNNASLFYYILLSETESTEYTQLKKQHIYKSTKQAVKVIQ